MVTPSVPPGYERISLPGIEAITHATIAAELGDVLSRGTIYEWASSRAQRTFAGRVPAYATRLGDVPVVVRRNHHGGWLASFRGERFARPRAPRELDSAIRLAGAGVPTPDVLAYAVYAGGVLGKRSDVVTRELPAGYDLGALLATSPPSAAQVDAVRALLDSLQRASAWHPDLNIKNVYLTDEAPPRAYVLDVDRVRFVSDARTAATRNARRLLRSLDKRARAGGADVPALTSAVRGSA